MLETNVRKPLLAAIDGDETANGLAARVLRRLLKSASHGRLVLSFPHRMTLVLEGANPGARADIQLKRWRALRRLLVGGDIGFAGGYCDGDWETSDLKAVLAWGLENQEPLTALCSGSWASRFVRTLQHRLRVNTRTNSRRNIAAHYDLGNAFYAHWLDVGMNYSSGLYLNANDTLAGAQQRKLGRVIELLDLSGGERVLEIGCGWGALAERLAVDHNCQVTGLTLSARQLDYAQARLNRTECRGRVDLRLQDYRDVTGMFERIVSIEMLEAVGEQYWPVYFDILRQRLAPGGKAVLQVITIHPQYFEAYRRRPDFIQTHIFPGGMLPTLDTIRAHARQAGLEMNSQEQFAASYARTLADWRERFNNAWPSIAPLGFDERFRRLWNYYLDYCAAGFEGGAVSVGLYQLQRPRLISEDGSYDRAVADKNSTEICAGSKLHAGSQT